MVQAIDEAHDSGYAQATSFETEEEFNNPSKQEIKDRYLTKLSEILG